MKVKIEVTLAEVFEFVMSLVKPKGQPAQPANKITSETYHTLEPGDSIHWRGARFEFDGTVERVENYPVEDKLVFVRRSDTGKMVSLTAYDLDTGELTLK